MNDLAVTDRGAKAGRAREADADPPRARLMLWPGRGLYVGPLLPNVIHVHHALQLTIALTGRIQVRAGQAGRWRTTAIAVTAADQAHAIRGEATTVQIYLDPAGAHARQLAPADPASHRRVMIGARACIPQLERLWSFGAAPAEWKAAIDGLCALDVSRAHRVRAVVDARVSQLLDTAHRADGQAKRIADAARAIGLSASRAAHLFSESTGLPWRRYLLWLRLINAVTRIRGSGSLTAAAHDAGFADSAHLSRTFRRMFGIAPSALLAFDVDLHVDPAGWMPFPASADTSCRA